MQNYKDYYRSQIERLDLGQLITIQLTDGDGYKTKYLTLNNDSIEAINELFAEILKRSTGDIG